MSESGGWIGVDLDGTLAHYDDWVGPTHIGKPIESMVERVKQWLKKGQEVRVFTARIAPPIDNAERLSIEAAIHDWTQDVFGRPLEVTCVKDREMVELWDDRAVAVEKNTGRTLADRAVAAFLRTRFHPKPTDGGE